MNYKGKVKVLLFFMFLASSSHGMAQIIEVPLSRAISLPSNFRIKSDPISLPLWDDFSKSGILPDTSYWVVNTSVFINPGIGKNPPTLNIATLDGWDAFGNHYSQDPQATGKTDSLLSQPINLSEVPSSLRNTIFLSFFYQMEGNGDKPNDTDSLILQFKKPDGSWKTVWPLPGESVNTQSNIFVQKIIQVTDDFIGPDFQFKFQAHGRQSGPFDTWNLDYIYLDKRRSATDGIDYLDRAFTSVPSSITGPYTAIPKVHFFQNPNQYLDSATTGFTNLERQVQPVEYSVKITDLFSGATLEYLVDDSAFLALRYPLGNRILKAGHLDPSKLDQNKDSLYLKTDFIMDSGDKFLIDSVYNNGQDTAFVQSVDLRVNDTTSVLTILHDYYAYDDGTAEFGAGINQLNGRIAVKYIPAGPGIIKYVDINFQNIGRIFAGTPIDLFVLRDLDKNSFSLLGTLSATVQVTDNLNDFVRYEFGKPIAVLDTFYIGYQQSSNDLLAMGLDKNTDNGDQIYYNITGDWVQNTDVHGSLMIRPVFTDELVNAIEDKMQSQISVFPNPTNGRIELSVKPEEFKLYNLQGQELNAQPLGNTFDLSGLPPSVYILMLRYKNRWEQHKIIRSY